MEYRGKQRAADEAAELEAFERMDSLLALEPEMHDRFMRLHFQRAIDDYAAAIVDRLFRLDRPQISAAQDEVSPA